MSSEVETSVDDSIERFFDSARNDKEALAFGFCHSFVIGHSREHVGGAARVINDAMRLEQRRNHHHALCSGVYHAL